MDAQAMEAIYNRLNSVTYTPLSADTFGDWTIEAGDILTVSKDGTNYQTPVMHSTLRWTGGSSVYIESTGNKEREPLNAQSKQAYESGYGGYYAGRHQSGLNLAFQDEFGYMRSYIDMTEEHLWLAFENDLSCTRSEFLMTSESLRIAFENEISCTRSEFQMTSESLRISFENDLASTRSEFEMTAESLRTNFENEIDGMSSQIEQNASQIALKVNRGDVATQLAVEAGNVTVQGGNLVVEGMITAENIQASIADLSVLNVKAISASGNITSSNGVVMAPYFYLGTSGNARSLANAITALRLQQNGDQYTLQKQDFDDATWVDVGTFNRASGSSKVSGTWTGGTYTVVADANGQDLPLTTTVYQSIVGTPNPSETVYANVYKDNPNDSSNVILSSEMTLTENVSAKKVSLIYSTLEKGAISTEATYNAGQSAVHLTSSWNADNDRLTIGKTTSGSINTYSFDISAKPTITYNPTTHKYTAIAQAKVDDVVRGDASSVIGGTEAYEAGWDYGLSQIVRTARTATSQELTVKSLAYGERWTIVDTKTSSSGSTTKTKYTVEAPESTDAYAAGWAEAYEDVSLPAAGTGESISVTTPSSTVDGTPITLIYTLNDAGKNVVSLTNPSGTVVARLTHNRYNGGWAAAYAKVSLPTTGTGESFSVGTPPSTVDGNATTTTYTLSSPTNDIVRVTSNSGTVVGQITHGKYTQGQNDLKDAGGAYGPVRTNGQRTLNQYVTTLDVEVPTSSITGLAIDTTNHQIKTSTSSTDQSVTITCEKVSRSYTNSSNTYVQVFQSKADSSVIANVTETFVATEAYNAGRDSVWLYSGGDGSQGPLWPGNTNYALREGGASGTIRGSWYIPKPWIYVTGGTPYAGTLGYDTTVTAGCEDTSGRKWINPGGSWVTPPDRYQEGYDEGRAYESGLYSRVTMSISERQQLSSGRYAYKLTYGPVRQAYNVGSTLTFYDK